MATTAFINNPHTRYSTAQRFAERVVLITGGGTGIGRATAEAFAHQGAHVVVTDVVGDAARETCRRITESGGIAEALTADVTHRHDVEQMIGFAVERFGALHIALNNAGIEGQNDQPTHLYDESVFRRVMEVNVMGVFTCMQAELHYWLSAKQPGIIVNTASIAGINGFPFHAAYAASKFAVIGMTKTAALEYARKGIRINAVCPGYTNTPMWQNSIAGRDDLAQRTLATVPMQHLAEPEEIASAILFLCSPDARYITGHAQIVDGGVCAY
jgi:NAD(P)-dependent dehydrogenase (short-subunit alcohol dehydrogenase family)